MLLKKRLQSMTILVACFAVLLVSAIIGWQVYMQSSKIIKNNKIDQLVSIRNSKAENLRDYFATAFSQVRLYADDNMVITATREFVKAYNNYAVDIGAAKDTYSLQAVKNYLDDFARTYASKNGGATIDPSYLINVKDATAFALQYNYIIENPFKATNKSELNFVNDNSRYSVVHKKYHRKLKEINDTLGFYDIVIVDASTGNVVYTVAKELGFASSLERGPSSKTNLAKVYQRAKIAGKGYITISDFARHPASFNDHTSFIAAPIFDEVGRKSGVIIFQLSTAKLNSILTDYGNWEEFGLGATGENYIVGQDGTMRSFSRLLLQQPKKFAKVMQGQKVPKNVLATMVAKNTTIGLQAVNTIGARAVLAGKTGFSEYVSYKGNNVYGAYEPLNIPGLDWGIISEIETAESLSVLTKLFWLIVLSSVIAAAIVCFLASAFAVVVAEQISGPVDKFCQKLKQIAATKDLTKRITVASNYDEMLSLTREVNSLLENMQEYFQSTINSTYEMQTAATKIMDMAEHVREVEPKQQQKPDVTAADDVDMEAATTTSYYPEEHSRDLEIAGADLSDLSAKLQDLSKQFKVFEDEAERTSGW